MELHKALLNCDKDSICLISGGSEFHSEIAEGTKDFANSSVLLFIVTISFGFLRLYGVASSIVVGNSALRYVGVFPDLIL